MHLTDEGLLNRIADLWGVKDRKCDGNHPKGGCEWEKVLETAALVTEAIEKAARIAERPVRGNGHSEETALLSDYAVETGRMIRDIKGPHVLPPRRLK